MQVAEKIIYLAGSAGNSDHAPAAQHREVQQLLRERVRQIRAQFDQVMARDLEAYKTLLRQRNIQNVIISGSSGN
jgi:aspartate aminotransferase-like enzyme